MNTKYSTIRSSITILIVCLLTQGLASAQAPERIGYQTVVRVNGITPVTSSVVGMKISINKSTPEGLTLYSERQTPLTDLNGLATVEIGAGTVISGSLAAIDWSSGSYFVKTETDPSGGTNYAITVTHQLLSLPYAMHAGTAETITDGVPESDPLFSAWSKDYNDMTNKPEMINAPTYAVGDYAYGGIVIWVDQTGHHGLLCSLSNQGPFIWDNESMSTAQAKGDGILAGELNTIIINAHPVSSGVGPFVAYNSCPTYYMPSKMEMNLIYQNRAIINATALAHSGEALIATAVYWTSTEISSTAAWGVDFYNQSTNTYSKLNKFLVRPVKAF